LDTDLVTRARRDVREAGFAGSIQICEGDAGDPSLCADAAPANLVLLAGVFGSISDSDVHQTIRFLSMLCEPDARVIWTRHRKEPDLTVAIRGWLAGESFQQRAFDAPEDVIFSVGVHDYNGGPRPWSPPRSPFTFIR